VRGQLDSKKERGYRGLRQNVDGEENQRSPFAFTEHQCGVRQRGRVREEENASEGTGNILNRKWSRTCVGIRRCWIVE